MPGVGGCTIYSAEKLMSSSFSQMPSLRHEKLLHLLDYAPMVATTVSFTVLPAGHVIADYSRGSIPKPVSWAKSWTHKEPWHTHQTGYQNTCTSYRQIRESESEQMLLSDDPNTNCRITNFPKPLSIDASMTTLWRIHLIFQSTVDNNGGRYDLIYPLG